CASCHLTLENNDFELGHCEVHRTCVSCTRTQVSYPRVGECPSARINCPSALASPRVRLHKTDNTYVDVEYSGNGLLLSCSAEGWTHTDSRGVEATNIKMAICFGTTYGHQTSPIQLNTTSASHTELYDAKQFVVKYGEGIVHDIKLERSRYVHSSR
ncbi:hypothetical protein PENTCL1PPCAC_4693, partial [Pristionchus entomophagus]